MVDTHTHLFDAAFDADRAAVIQRAIAAGVQKMILPAIDAASHAQLVQVYHQYSELLLPCMGLHPTSVQENYRTELACAEAYLKDTSIPWVAIGEIGLDYYWTTQYKAEQKIVFETQLNWSVEKNLPVVIHCREAMGDILHLLSDLQLPLRGIFHAYSGSLESYAIIKRLGDFKLGIGGVVTYKNSHLPEVLAQVPLEDIVLETDAPYLSPVPYRGKRNESAYLPVIVDKLAEIYQCGADKIRTQTNKTATKMFGF